MTQGQVQLGKNGLTENFIGTLKNHFNKHKNVRIIVLKSAGRERGKVKEYSKEILEKLDDAKIKVIIIEPLKEGYKSSFREFCLFYRPSFAPRENHRS